MVLPKWYILWLIIIVLIAYLVPYTVLKTVGDWSLYLFWLVIAVVNYIVTLAVVEKTYTVEKR